MRSWAERSFNSQYLQLFLTTVVALNIVPFAGEVPIWILATASVFIIWSALYVYRLVRLPNRLIRWIFAIACMSGVFFQFKSIFGQEPATALLILLASLKLLETVRYRDAMYVTFISYFLLMDYVLISQTLPATIFMIFSIALITTLLFYLHGDRGKLSLRSLTVVMRTLWLAIPIWLFLFIVFPRFSAALWTVNPDTRAMSGFSDELNPGAISSLIESDELAFRATFLSGPEPRYAEMYWRGGILWQTEGLKWTKKGYSSTNSLTVNQPQHTVHEVVLEPGFQRFVFGLDSPVSVTAAGHSPQAILMRPGFVFERQAPATIRVLYTIHSVLNSDEPPLQKFEKDVFLEAPEPSTKLSELVETIKRSAQTSLANSPEEKLSDALVDYFLANGFRYTKSPGATADLDDFLFNKKVGFCEHYAGGYATIMRLLGVPSRVVIGFHGGVKNRLAEHWSVRALDAHAWSEIYVEGSGWKRVDLTSFIAPLRLALGGDFNNIDPTGLDSNMTREQYELRFQNSALQRWINNSSLAFDLLSSRWNNFLLKYDFEYQSAILNSLGVQSGQRAWLLASLLVGTALLLLLTRFWIRRGKKKIEPIVSAYRELCTELRLRGLPRLPSEGPLKYAGRVALAWPSRANEMHSLLEEYSEYRYGTAPINVERARDWKKRALALSRRLPKLK